MIEEEKKNPTSKPLKLKIVFDTNQLFSGSASDLLSIAISNEIEAGKKHSDINIEWYIPEVVVQEREFQMLETAHSLIPSVEKFERLLGFHLEFGADMLSAKVKEAVQKSISKFDLKVIPLETRSIDWKRLINDALFRKPPFERVKEKGFRDALIVESFIQLVNECPKSPSLCRIILFSNDDLLSLAVESRSSEFKNVRRVRSLDELQSLINTLASSVTESFVANIVGAAKLFFFDLDKKSGLFYNENIQDLIFKRFVKNLNEIPDGWDSRENGTWYINAPNFVKKVGQRIFWKTQISIAVECKRNKISLPTPALQPLIHSTLSYGGLGGVEQNPLLQALASSQFRPNFSPTPLDSIATMKGQSLFDVTWSVQITATKKLRKAKIENIEERETFWNEGNV